MKNAFRYDGARSVPTVVTTKNGRTKILFRSTTDAARSLGANRRTVARRVENGGGWIRGRYVAPARVKI